MKKIISLFALVGLLAAGPVFARNDINNYSIHEVMSQARTANILGDQIKFYFADESHAPVVKDFGLASTNKKTNAFNKSDKEACQWVLLSALKSLRDRAIAQGGNAVVNIRSNYENHPFTSSKEFQCGNGFLMAGVALQGEVVKLK
ncbi:excinuclease [Dongshaea marina]|uniref:excinuclease n=1 Tax=Dongshaea marina TaxID=2047966 RepID=UPI000D3E1F77|nr:excinuclease [Dongshaea marina]